MKSRNGWWLKLNDVHIEILLIILFINMFEIFHSQKFIKAILKIPHTYVFMFINSSFSEMH